MGEVALQAGRTLSESEQAFVQAVARQVGQQVESLRLLSDAARARAAAEEATRLLTRQSWQEFAQEVEPATAVAFAGYEKLLKTGTIQSEETVVINATGHTFPVEKHVLGDQWAVDIHLSETQAPAPQEGLQAALEHLDEKTKTVLLIDDNADDALLIRRLLEARKSYRVFHAHDGWEGLSMARQKLPDLIVSDLTMPGIDGFGLVEELKLDPRTRHIPVILVSAKDITTEERRRLNGHIEAVYQKGSLPPRKFVDQVVSKIEEDKADSPPSQP